MVGDGVVYFLLWVVVVIGSCGDSRRGKVESDV
jgi:hypothetical protein